MIVQVPKHKTCATHGASRMAMSAALYTHLRLYIEHIRCKVMSTFSISTYFILIDSDIICGI